MKTAIAVSLLSLTINAHAGSNAQGPHGGIAAARGIAASRAASQASHGGQNGRGGSYWTPAQNASLVDAYQPWPQSEMASFAKPKWEPYAGD